MTTPSQIELHRRFPEWIQFEQILEQLRPHGQIHQLGTSTDGRYEFPLIGMSFGNPDPGAPALVITGGVHGLERIGSQVALALMKYFAELISWDNVLKSNLKSMRIGFFPIVNPLGVLNVTRANPNGVDLMRNAPVESSEKPTFLVGGHRLSPRLPWYRGPVGGQMETESKALLSFVKDLVWQSKASISVDLHSGFGLRDRLWFPYARSKDPFPNLAQAHALKDAFDRTYPHHVYVIEPQAHSYTTQGDLWDYAYEEFRHQPNLNGRVFLPMALEMGSWLWVKKNPLQLFSSLGPFNPVKAHRKKRILRRHLPLFDFLVRAIMTPENWALLRPENEVNHHHRAMESWYQSPSKSA